MGEILTSSGTMAEINPLRYRGYYYDTETGFYYLQSRYYDPAMHRFINADSLASTGQGIVGTNMFAYCLNSPVVYVDQQGNLALRIGSGADFALFGGGGRFDGGMPISAPRVYSSGKNGSNQKGWAEVGGILGYTKGAILCYEDIVSYIEWMIDNRALMLDWIAAIEGTASTIIGMGITLNLINIPVAGQIAIAVVTLCFAVWTIGRLSDWW